MCVCVLAYGGGHKKEDVERGLSLLFICSYCLLPLTFTANFITPGDSPLHFYRAMLCIRGTSHGPVSVRLSVCPSQVGVLLKRLSVASHKQHRTIAQGL